MSDFDLNAFLTSQQAEGVSVGEGGFTISHEKASQKMSKYSLPREHAWVLKLVQAAVGWNCQRLTLTQTRTTSTFAFSLESFGHLPSNQELVTAILRAELERDDPLSSLATALRVLVERAHLSFLLLIDKDDAESQAIYAGVYFAEMDEEKRARQRQAWGKGVTLQIHHIAHTEVNRLLLHHIPIRRHGLPMLQELEHYAYVSPVPIFVDGRRVDGVLRSSALAWTYRKKPLRLSGMEILGKHDPAFDICGDLRDVVLQVGTSLKEALALVDQQEKIASQAYFVLGIEVPKERHEVQKLVSRCEVCWVKQGVVVESSVLPPLTKHLSLQLYLSAEGLGTDLTGFHLTRNEVYADRRNRAVESLARALVVELVASRYILPKTSKVEEARVVISAEMGVKRAFSTFSSRVVQGVSSAIDVFLNPVADWEAFEISHQYTRELAQISTELQPGKADSQTLDSASETELETPPALRYKPHQKFEWTPPDGSIM